MKSLISIFIVGMLLIGYVLTPRSEGEARFQAALQAQQLGDHKRAIRIYDLAIDSGELSDENLALAYREVDILDTDSEAVCSRISSFVRPCLSSATARSGFGPNTL